MSDRADAFAAAMGALHARLGPGEKVAIISTPWRAEDLLSPWRYGAPRWPRMSIYEREWGMTERTGETVVQAAEHRARALRDFLATEDGKQWVRSQVPMAAHEAVKQLPFDVERLCAEVRRLRWVHEAAEELATVFRDHAFHEQARLVRNGGQPFVPNRDAASTALRMAELQAKIRDGLANHSGVVLVLDRDRHLSEARTAAERAERLLADREGRLKAAEASLARANDQRLEAVARIQDKLDASERERLRLLEASVEHEELEAEVARLKAKVNLLLGRLRDERAAKERTLAKRLARLLVRGD